MIKTHSEDPDVEAAAIHAFHIINETIEGLPRPTAFDYGGHILQVGEFDVCKTCTLPIAEAQAAATAILKQSELVTDPVVKEHLELAAQLFKAEADAATLRAELHNGQGTEKILNLILGYQYDHDIHDDYHHSHRKGK